MRERIVDIDSLPESLADALEQTRTWEYAEDVTRCGDCLLYDKAAMSCSGGMDADMWPSDFCCFGVRVVSPRKPTKEDNDED